jgi:hypothetical protein
VDKGALDLVAQGEGIHDDSGQGHEASKREFTLAGEGRRLRPDCHNYLIFIRHRYIQGAALRRIPHRSKPARQAQKPGVIFLTALC